MVEEKGNIFVLVLRLFQIKFIVNIWTWIEFEFIFNIWKEEERE